MHFFLNTKMTNPDHHWNIFKNKKKKQQNLQITQSQIIKYKTILFKHKNTHVNFLCLHNLKNSQKIWHVIDFKIPIITEY